MIKNLKEKVYSSYSFLYILEVTSTYFMRIILATSYPTFSLLVIFKLRNNYPLKSMLKNKIMLTNFATDRNMTYLFPF